MGLLDGLLKQRAAGRLLRDAEQLLEGAERLELSMSPHAAAARQELVTETAGLALAKLLEAERAGLKDRDHLNLRHAQVLLLLRRADEALTPALAAANARPYDVDSRIIHGRVRLALGQLRQASHESSRSRTTRTMPPSSETQTFLPIGRMETIFPRKGVLHTTSPAWRSSTLSLPAASGYTAKFPIW